MRYELAGSTFVVSFYGYDTGLVGTCGVQIDGSGADGGRATTGITEDPEGSGIYVCTLDAPLAPGAWRIAFDDGGTPPRFSVEDLVVNLTGLPPSAGAGYVPSVQDIADHLLQRTTDEYSNILGSFTDATAPTAVQVQALIDKSAWKYLAKFGPTVVDELAGSAREVISLRTAMQVELSYFGSQIRADRSPYIELSALHDAALKDFLLERKQLGADLIAGTADDLSGAGLPATVQSLSGVGGLVW